MNGLDPSLSRASTVPDSDVPEHPTPSSGGEVGLNVLVPVATRATRGSVAESALTATHSSVEAWSASPGSRDAIPSAGGEGGFASTPLGFMLTISPAFQLAKLLIEGLGGGAGANSGAPGTAPPSPPAEPASTPGAAAKPSTTPETEAAEKPVSTTSSNPANTKSKTASSAPAGTPPASRPAASASGASNRAGSSTAAASTTGGSEASAKREFPKSPSGTPLYWQGDATWSKETLGEGHTVRKSGAEETVRGTLGSAGCAVTSTAMTLSALAGRTITPLEVDRFLDTHQGYQGDALTWQKAADLIGATASNRPWDLTTVDADLSLGRPVVIGVNQGIGGRTQTNHYVALTRKDPNDPALYFANDPATGKETAFRKTESGALESLETAPNSKETYLTSGSVWTFAPKMTP